MHWSTEEHIANEWLLGQYESEGVVTPSPGPTPGPYRPSAQVKPYIDYRQLVKAATQQSVYAPAAITPGLQAALRAQQALRSRVTKAPTPVRNTVAYRTAEEAYGDKPVLRALPPPPFKEYGQSTDPARLNAEIESSLKRITEVTQARIDYEHERESKRAVVRDNEVAKLPAQIKNDPELSRLYAALFANVLSLTPEGRRMGMGMEFPFTSQRISALMDILNRRGVDVVAVSKRVDTAINNIRRAAAAKNSDIIEGIIAGHTLEDNALGWRYKADAASDILPQYGYNAFGLSPLQEQQIKRELVEKERIFNIKREEEQRRQEIKPNDVSQLGSAFRQMGTSWARALG